MATTIHVALKERSYDIEIGHGNLASLPRFIGQRRASSRAVVIGDANVSPLHGQRVADALAAQGMKTDLHCVPAGETTKCVAEAERLWNEMARLGIDRKTMVVAVGGGVVGDLAGFVAATYGRGLPLVQVPTTLLAQVDSSVGGKVGINLPTAKNMVGAFWQPIGVLIDLDTLRSLPEREYRSGLAEVLKYGVILDVAFFEYLEQNADAILKREPAALEHIVARSCRLKADVVEQDEHEETGLRAVLNYGHTFCHAIEAVAGYGVYLHGEAVSIGMIAASRLSELLGRIGPDVTERQIGLLKRFELPISSPDLDREQLLAAMQHDKKAENGRLRFVLPSQIGHVDVVSSVDPQLVHRALG